MTSYLNMAWWLADSLLNGTMDEEYPVKLSDTVKNLPKTDDETYITQYPDDDLQNGEGIYYGNNYGYEYTHVDGENITTTDAGQPFTQDFLADNDDNAAHHFGSYEEANLKIHATSPYNDGWTQQAAQEELDKLNNEVQQSKNMANYFKYHEEEILKDIEEYVSSTYRGHYTGTQHEYRNVQTIDLMASRDLAPDFCQANILKYGSRYGSKDGRSKKDLLKVIHYAMLLLHFDDHYGKPSITTGNIDHNMP